MELSEWRPHPTCRNTKVVKLTIGDQTWEALRYRWLGEDAIYVLGELPKRWDRNDKHRIILDGEEWVIISYLDTFDGMSPRIQKYHPFGNHWIMSVWECSMSLPWPTMEATIE